MNKAFGILTLLSLTSLLMCARAVERKTCPDGNSCSGECCHKYPLGYYYRCCEGIWKCKYVFGLGICSALSESKHVSTFLTHERKNLSALEEKDQMQTGNENEMNHLELETELRMAETRAKDRLDENSHTQDSRPWDEEAGVASEERIEELNQSIEI